MVQFHLLKPVDLLYFLKNDFFKCFSVNFKRQLVWKKVKCRPFLVSAASLLWVSFFLHFISSAQHSSTIGKSIIFSAGTQLTCSFFNHCPLLLAKYLSPQLFSSRLTTEPQSLLRWNHEKRKRDIFKTGILWVCLCVVVLWWWWCQWSTSCSALSPNNLTLSTVHFWWLSPFGPTNTLSYLDWLRQTVQSITALLTVFDYKQRQTDRFWQTVSNLVEIFSVSFFALLGFCPPISAERSKSVQLQLQSV